MKIRILMIGMTMNIGGVETYIMNLLRVIDRDKFEVYIPSLQNHVAYKSELIKLGVVLIDTPASRHNYFQYCAKWKELFEKYKFDVVYFNTCDIVAIDILKFAKKAGIPIRIIHAHSAGNQQGIEHGMSIFHRLSEKNSRKHLHEYATHFFACSKVAGDWMFDGREYKVIQNGINLGKYKYDKNNRKRCREKLSINDELLIGVVGRLSPPKNPFLTVEIAEVIIDRKENARVVMIGDGELRREVELKVDQKQLQDSVLFTGAVNNVNEWMSAIDCLLMPSLFEGLPFVLVEAQAAGVPCVVSSAVSEEVDLTGLVEFIDLTEETEVWADKILEACQKERLDTTQQLIDAGYSITETAKTVSEIIEKSLGKA